jgi:hypothetical protein
MWPSVPSTRERPGGGRLAQAGDAEVEDLARVDPGVDEEEVARLGIAVEGAARVPRGSASAVRG